MDSESAIFLACHVHDAFANAPDWNALVATLAERGFHLQFEGTRLVLVNEQTGMALCTCSSFGFGCTALTQRLGKPTVLAVSGKVIARPRS